MGLSFRGKIYISKRRLATTVYLFVKSVVPSEEVRVTIWVTLSINLAHILPLPGPGPGPEQDVGCKWTLQLHSGLLSANRE